MGMLKALGSNGFPLCIFQKYWHVFGEKVVEAVSGMFRRDKLIEGINESLICLIPKGEAPELISQFRPISLCNVLAKVVTKVLANRLKPIMSKLTGRYQSSFIPGRSTIDNIVVLQEFVHSLSRRKGQKWAFILKVDLQKAYDRIHWGFLWEVLQITRFKHDLINLVMDCVTSASLAVC